jgi:hypothetical protein
MARRVYNLYFSLDISNVIESSRMRWMKPEGTRPFVVPKRRWKGNTKVDVREWVLNCGLD